MIFDPPEVRVFTIGHADRAPEEFLGMLRAAGVEFVVDVRSRPTSRRAPWSARPVLQQTLAQAGVGYAYMGESLGGLRDDFEARRETVAYRTGLEEQARLAAGRPTAILCAERDPRACHRFAVADDLARRGLVVVHLVDPGRNEPHPHPLTFR
ncbi:MAG: DUF488 domain-containing protein [Candidatus Polarisedimenticolia bacterium]